MTASTAQERLAEILHTGFSGTGLELVQISTNTGELDFADKAGWLRYQSDLQHSDCLETLDEAQFGRPLAGEWIVDDTKTARLSVAQGVRHIQEHRLDDKNPLQDKWLPALREIVEVSTRPVDDRGAGRMKHAIYYGFRNEAEASEGNLRRLCDRMIGWEAAPPKKSKEEDE